jgi:hypothetical protein
VTYVCFSAGGGRDRCFDILLLKQEKDWAARRRFC